MQTRPLLDIALGALLGSPALAELLRQKFVARDGGLVLPQAFKNLRNSCREELARELDRAWPRRFRTNELQRVAMHICHDGLFESPRVPVLDEIFKNLMQRDGDLIYYQPHQVQAYARLASELDPVLLAAWHLAQWLRGFHRPSTVDVLRVVNSQMPLFTPPPRADKPVADNHVHLSGIDGADSMLALHILGKLPVAELKSDGATVLRLRHLLRWLMNLGGSTYNQSSASMGQGIPIGCLSGLQRICGDDPSLQLEPDPDWAIVCEQLESANAVGLPWMQRQMLLAWLNQRPARAWLWLKLWLCFAYQDSNTDTTWRVAIFYFMAQALALRRKLIVDGQGLRRFTELYYSPILRSAVADRQDNEFLEPARRMLAAATDKAEIKITPKKFRPDIVKAFVKASCPLTDQLRTLDCFFNASRPPPSALELQHANDMEKWHFCLHFVRKPPSGQKLNNTVKFSDVGFVRRLLRTELWTESRNLLTNVRRSAGWNSPEFLFGPVRQGLRFHPGRWVRGLDVAGDESAWPIEFFAPQLRALRNNMDKIEPGMPASRGFHFSIHAGEDYAHPLSGLRHTDETVLFCEMRDGDRLGHALALGVPPRQWFDGHGDVLIPVDEHLDNLVWAWHRATELAPRLELAGRVIPRLERRIERFLPHASWRQPMQSSLLGPPGRAARSAFLAETRADPAVLHRAWLLRRNCPALLEKEQPAAPMLDDRLLAAVPDLERLLRHLRRKPDEAGDAAVRDFLRRAALEHERTPAPRLVLIRAQGDASLHRQESREWDPRHDDDELLHDHELPEEIEFMEALQDHLLSLYACMGLWIETNPSSNVYIARLDTHAEHPIFRWSPPDEADLAPGKPFNRFGLRRGPMNVLVNTDDPGIMPTTLRMEFELLREAGMDLGYTRAQVEQWLEGIRRAGLEQFERNHLPVFELAA